MKLAKIHTTKPPLSPFIKLELRTLHEDTSMDGATPQIVSISSKFPVFQVQLLGKTWKNHEKRPWFTLHGQLKKVGKSLCKWRFIV
jgi:hypothetical protein